MREKLEMLLFLAGSIDWHHLFLGLSAAFAALARMSRGRRMRADRAGCANCAECGGRKE